MLALSRRRFVAALAASPVVLASVRVAHAVANRLTSGSDEVTADSTAFTADQG